MDIQYNLQQLYVFLTVTGKHNSYLWSWTPTPCWYMPPQTESVQEPLPEEPEEPSVEISDSAEPTKEISYMVESSTEQPDLYAQRCKEYQREQEQRRQNTINAFMKYVTHTMSPYIYDNEELEKLCDAIRKWT